MLVKRLKNIQKILKDFTGKNGEPKYEKELYILKSMWVMMLSEFEGIIKDIIEHHIDNIKKIPIENKQSVFKGNGYIFLTYEL